MLSRRTLALLAVAALASAAEDAQPKPPGLSEFRKDVRTLLASQPAQAAKLLKEAFAKLPPAGDAEEEGYSPTQEHADLLSDLAEAYLRSKQYEQALKVIDVALGARDSPIRTRAMLLQTQARTLISGSAKRVDVSRCDETAPAVREWLNAAQKAVELAQATGVELPDLPTVRRRLKRQRVRIADACPD